MSSQPIIAIVDDDQAIREAIVDLLRSYGYDSRVFASAEEYLAFDENASISCMLDVKMPGMSGLELQRSLKCTRDLKPIIFLASHFEENVRREAVVCGAAAFLGKPVPIDVLIGHIRAVAGPGQL
jgi:FixJ family two-component response regulator